MPFGNQCINNNNNNLTDSYDGFVANITQSLRNDSEAYSIEMLFSNLLDESKRQESRDVTGQAECLAP